MELDLSGREHEVVILLRGLNRPGCLSGWRIPAVEPHADPMGPESWTTVVWANLEGDLQAIGYGLPRNCSSGVLTWF